MVNDNTRSVRGATICSVNSMFNNIPRYGVYGHVHNHTIIYFYRKHDV